MHVISLEHTTHGKHSDMVMALSVTTMQSFNVITMNLQKLITCLFAFLASLWPWHVNDTQMTQKCKAKLRLPPSHYNTYIIFHVSQKKQKTSWPCRHTAVSVPPVKFPLRHRVPTEVQLPVEASPCHVWARDVFKSVIADHIDDGTHHWFSDRDKQCFFRKTVTES